LFQGACGRRVCPGKLSDQADPADRAQTWRRGLRFTTPASVSNAYAATLIGAALSRTRLAHD
jgi:hypothetical protein